MSVWELAGEWVWVEAGKPIYMSQVLCFLASQLHHVLDSSTESRSIVKSPSFPLLRFSLFLLLSCLLVFFLPNCFNKQNKNLTWNFKIVNTFNCSPKFALLYYITIYKYQKMNLNFVAHTLINHNLFPASCVTCNSSSVSFCHALSLLSLHTFVVAVVVFVVAIASEVVVLVVVIVAAAAQLLVSTVSLWYPLPLFPFSVCPCRGF